MSQRLVVHSEPTGSSLAVYLQLNLTASRQQQPMTWTGQLFFRDDNEDTDEDKDASKSMNKIQNREK